MSTTVFTMGKKKVEENPNSSEQKEGHNLLGAPTFKQLENGRFKCVETGHELPAHARDLYAESKHCRQGLIDSALARNKPPLNMFKQDPACRSKLVCKLTGLTINKSEEHIWKHINGKRFLNMLDKMETGKDIPNGAVGKQDEEKVEKKNKKHKDGSLKKKRKIKKDEKQVDEIVNEVRDSADNSSDMESEDDFWMPPSGERWDHDDGGDRWASDSDTGDAGEEDVANEEVHEAGELSKRTKRMSLEIGPSSFASRKKKKKINVA